jgi:hypothetical protein
VQKVPQRMNGLDEFLKQGRPIGVRLFVEQLLREIGIVNGGDEVALLLKGNAALSEFASEPKSTIESDADGEREPTLNPDIAQAEALVKKIVIQMGAANGFLARLEESLAVFAEAKRQAGFLTGKEGDASAGALVLAREFESDGFLVDGRTIQMDDGDAFAVGEGVGLLAEDAGEFFAVIGKVLAEDAALIEITTDAARVVKKSRFAAESQAIESGQYEEHQRLKTG